MKFPARSAEPHQKLFWSNVLVIFNQSKPRELSHCRLLPSICFRCSKLLPSLWNWYFYQRSIFSLFSGFAEQAGNIGIILELVIDQTVIAPYCYRIITLYRVWLSGSELYRRIFVKSVKVSVYSFNLFLGFSNRCRDGTCMSQWKFKMTEMKVDWGGRGVRGCIGEGVEKDA